MGIRFSLREHQRNPSFPPVVTFSKPSGSVVRGYSNVGGISYIWMFFVVPRTWIHGKYIRLRWTGTFGNANWSTAVRVYDGSYDRSSDVDFPDDVGPLLKGNGLLQTYLGHTGSFAYTTQEQLVDVSGGSLDDVTVFILTADSWAQADGRVDLDWFEVNAGSGGAGTILFEGFDDSVTMELTGTTGDYGYISDGDAPPESQDLFAKFRSRQAASQNLFAKLEIQDSEDLFADFVVRQADVEDLKGEFHVGQGSENLFAKFLPRHEATENLFAKVQLRQWYRDLPVRFIVRHPGSSNFFAKFELQKFEVLFAKAIIRQAGSADLKALPLISSFGQHIKGDVEWLADETIFGSQWTPTAKGQVQKIVFFHEHTGTPDNQASAAIYAVSAGKPGSKLIETGSIALTAYGEQEISLGTKIVVEQGTAYFILVQIDGSASGNSKVRYKTTGSGTKGFTKSASAFPDPMTGGASRSYEFTIYATYKQITDASADLKGVFEVAQGTADLFAKVILRQGIEDLLAKFVLPVNIFLFAEFEVGQDSNELYAKFETQAVLDLVAEFTVRHPASADLLGFFRVNNYSVDLRAKFEVRKETSIEIFSDFLLRRSASSELKAVFDSAPYRFENLKGIFTVRHTGTPQELYAKFELQDSADLKCVIQWISQTGTIPDVTPIIGDYIAQWLNYTKGVHRGFISTPTIRDDPVIKDEGVNSCRIESVYEARQYKEITFGWTYNDADYGPGGSQAVDPSAGGIVYANSPVQSRDDRANYIRRASSNSLFARFYVMANLLDFPNWQDLGRPGAWWEFTHGTQGQTNPQADYVEAVMINYTDSEDNLGGAWHYIGTKKTYLGGTITFDLQFQDAYSPGGGLMGTRQTAGLTLAREMQYYIWSFSMVIWYDSQNDIWYFTVANEDGYTHTDISAFANFEQRHIYQIIWETPAQYPLTGRVRLYIDNILRATVTTNVMENRLTFGFGADVARIGAKMRAGCRLYGYSDE